MKIYLINIHTLCKQETVICKHVTREQGRFRTDKRLAKRKKKTQCIRPWTDLNQKIDQTFNNVDGSFWLKNLPN